MLHGEYCRIPECSVTLPDMKTFAFCALLFLNSFAQALPLQCKADCQYFDDFHNRCLFQTTCDYANQCMRYSFCERWDDFKNQCVSVAVETKCHTPNPFVGSPGCTEKCQYFDDFQNKCLYRVRCEYFATCMRETRCDRWDDFYGKCLTEEKNVLCN